MADANCNISLCVFCTYAEATRLSIEAGGARRVGPRHR
jgi:hypothetical protein